MNSRLALLFQETNWCKIIDPNKNLDEEFEELFTLKNESKSSSTSSIEYTFDVIESIDLENDDEKRITTELLIEYVDRGINDWDKFNGKLASDYPSLKLLFISQNYSYDRNNIPLLDGESAELYNNRTDGIMTNKFLSFLHDRKLQIFAMYDFQSSFLQKIDPAKILNAQPSNILYSIVINRHNTLNKGTIFMENKNMNKQLFFHIRNNNDNK